MPHVATEHPATGAPPSAAGRQTRRADVEGLRIVAVLLVSIYHYTQAGVSGGVDVFLFISGYFVLGGLARRLERGEPLGVVAFYRRTARRLVPLAWLTAAVVGVAALTVAQRGETADLGRGYLASVAYVENWWLALSGDEYGATSTFLNPFQHFWSLSVQAQVFLAAPWVLAAAVWVRRRVAPRSGGSALVPVLALTTIAALVGWWLAAADQTAAYFSTAARAWEFLAGAALALGAPHVRLPEVIRVVLGWSGLALLCVTGLLIDGTHQYPGPWALVPLAAAAAIIVAGTAPTRAGVDRLLGLGPLARCGRYAYGLYLWHWPVMAIWLLATRTSRLGVLDAVVVSLIAVGLTVTTHHLVEQPWREPWSTRAPRQRLVGAVTVGAVVVASVGVGRATYEDVRWARTIDAIAANAELTEYPGAMSVLDPERYPVPDGVPVIPVPDKAAEAEATEEANEEGCPVIGDRTWCVFGHTTEYGQATGDFVLLGGSHSAAWHAPTHLAAERLGWAVTAYIRGGCPFAFGDLSEVVYDGAWTDTCAEWNELVLERLRADPPDVVVTTFSRPFAPDGAVEWVPQQYVTGWEELGRLGIEVIAVRANQGLPSVDFICPGEDPCTYPRSEIYGDDPTLLAIPVPENVHVLDMTQYACVDGVCPTVIGNIRVYADQTHLTGEWGRSAAPIFWDFVSDLLARTG